MTLKSKLNKRDNEEAERQENDSMNSHLSLLGKNAQDTKAPVTVQIEEENELNEADISS